MHYHTYILESETKAILYIGQSADVEKRLIRHNTGRSRFTKGKGPWRLLYSVSFETRSEAIRLENKLKSYKNPIKVREWIAAQMRHK